MVRNRVNRVIESDRIRVMWRKIYVSERKEGRKKGRKKECRLIAIRIRFMDVTIRSHCISVNHWTGLPTLHEYPSTRALLASHFNSKVTTYNVTYSVRIQPSLTYAPLFYPALFFL